MPASALAHFSTTLQLPPASQVELPPEPSPGGALIGYSGPFAFLTARDERPPFSLTHLLLLFLFFFYEAREEKKKEFSVILYVSVSAIQLFP